MIRISTISMLSLAAVGIANAGQIKLGSNQGADGLTSTYVTGINTCAATYVVNNGPAAAGCVTGGASAASTGGRIFKLVPASGALLNGVNLTSGAFPTGTLSTTDSSGTQVNFSSISGTKNTWSGYGGSAAVSLTIPVGIYATDKVWTVLSDFWGNTGGTETSVTFNFGDAPGQASGYDTVTYTLTNGVQIRNAVDCTGVATNPSTSPVGNDFNNIPGSQTGMVSCTNFAATASSSNTTNVWTATYDGDTNIYTQYYNTKGNANLDAQLFNFGNAFASQYLVSIVVTNTGGYPSGTNTANISQTALNAVTVDSLTASTPEPSTVMLLLSGLGVIGFRRFRRS